MFRRPAALWLRIRLQIVALAQITIGVGLWVHRTDFALLPAARDILGDALWAIMIFWWTGVVTPNALPWRRGVAALALCTTVEVSQLYHAPGVDGLRRTTLGQLTLGSGFDTRDLLAYAAGVLTAVLVESALRRRARQR
jgi:Protein of unknown function (DUF2809)